MTAGEDSPVPLQEAYDAYEAVRTKAVTAGYDPRYGNPHHAQLLLSGQGLALAVRHHLANPPALLTDAELEAMATTATLANQLRRIIGNGTSAAGDWAEAAHEIHAIQHRIMAQAAARAYPTEFRLLGGWPAPPPEGSG